jgi:hypothetical protein|tara:strand:+ start:156 stop:479 length:324 start_codon:yes stop_codon:yes gene_type:complete
MKIYISGPISNDPYHREAFDKAEDYLKHLGYDVINPLDIKEKEFKGPDKDFQLWTHYMRESIKLLMDCDQIYMLEKWKESRGAKIEHKLATDLSMPRIYEEEDIERV